MRIRASQAGENSFRLEADRLIENHSQPYFLLRKNLKTALKLNRDTVRYNLVFNGDSQANILGDLSQGKTQRGKKYIQIGCIRFVGDNRTKLIRWAKSGK